MEGKRKIRFTSDNAGERLDSFIVRKLDEIPAYRGAISRARIQKIISDELVLVDGVSRKKNYVLKGDELIEIEMPSMTQQVIKGEKHDFDILFEDEHIIAINKPAGLITHPTSIHSSGTLINGLLGRGIQLAPAGGAFRPGIVHRLDKETSGAILLAKTDKAYYGLVKIFKDRSIEKYYCAIVVGNLRDLKGEFEQNIGRHPRNRSKMTVLAKGGKEAKTQYTVLERFVGFDFLNMRIFTGRTHQIRVHLSNSGHSVLGDKIYGVKRLDQHIRSLGHIGLDAESIAALSKGIMSIVDSYPGMFLHSRKLALKHPITGSSLNLEAPFALSFDEMLKLLRNVTEKNAKK